MGTDDAELFSLFFTHLSVQSGEYLFIGCFHAFGAESRNICNFLRWVFQNPGRDCRGGFTENIREHIVQLEVGDSQAVLRPVLFPSCEIDEFPAVTHQIPKLTNIRWWDKTAGNKVVFEDVRNPLGNFAVNAVLAEEARKRQELFEAINPSTALIQGMVPSYVNKTQSLLNSIRMETAVSNLSKIDIPKCDIPKIDIDIPKINLGLDTSSPNEDTETNESEDDNNAEKH